MKEKNVILASASPRRKELLKLIFKDFDIVVSDAEEIVPDDIETYDYARFLAVLKAQNVAVKYPESLVIAADTTVLADGKILGKPKSPQEAKEMLSLLSNNIHKVITGCAMIKSGKTVSFSVETKVEFYELEDFEIETYINSKDCFDKAGGYGIQTAGGLFVKRIDGDYFNVVGLPVAELNRQLKKFLEESKF